jgi:acetyltransferase-like isoleucine patch superfamily enzyme
MTIWNLGWPMGRHEVSLDTGWVNEQPDFPSAGHHLISSGIRAALRDPWEAGRAFAAVLRAALTFRGCRSVGARARIYGGCFVSGASGIEIGERVLILGSSVRCELSTHDGGQLSIGDRVFLNYGTSISAHSMVRVEDDCKIGQYSIVMDCDWHELETPRHDGGHGMPRPVVLEQGVWLGARVTVLKGVTIGRGSVIGAGSVVVSDIPEAVVAAGVPARVIRELPFKASLDAARAEVGELSVGARNVNPAEIAPSAEAAS